MKKKFYGAGYDGMSPAVSVAHKGELDIYSPFDEADETPQIIDVEFTEKEKWRMTPVRVLIAVLSVLLLAAIVFAMRDKLPMPKNETVSTMSSIMDARVVKLREWVNGSQHKLPESTKLWATAFVDDYNVPQVDGVGRLFYTVINADDHQLYTMKNKNLAIESLDNLELIELCGRLRGAGNTESGSIVYKVGDDKHLAAYTYIPEYKWLILLDGIKE
jgi:hypothetical protein